VLTPETLSARSWLSSPAQRARRASDDDAYFAGWRSRELSRVERAGLVYLDYTGAALYPESLVRADAERLACSVLGNPHSEHRASLDASRDLEDARAAILDLLHAAPAEYEVVITANATAAIRLVAESFPFRDGSALALAADNHNSVNGVREHATRRGARVRTIELDGELRLRDPMRVLDRPPGAPSLFAYPAQSNFSGVRHPLTLVDEAHQRGWRVLLDAAAFLPTAELDLSRTAADFVALSVYKIAGFPSGVGALVARREALEELQRPWFSGGTVAWVSVRHARHRLATGAAGFEDGTVPYLALGAVRPALELARAPGRERLAGHLTGLTSELIESLAGLRHASGRPMVRIHGPESLADRGPTVAFTVHDAADAVIPYWKVEAGARDARIAVRGGCFCNPGCAETAFAFAERSAVDCLDALGDRFTVPRFADCLGGGAVGAVRASLGLGSVHADVERLVRFLEAYATGGAREDPNTT
jgi:selenocysteine lyase/cysteine desulfurase